MRLSIAFAFVATVVLCLCSCGSGGSGGGSSSGVAGGTGSTVTNRSYSAHQTGGTGHLGGQVDSFLTTSTDQSGAGTFDFTFKTKAAADPAPTDNSVHLPYPGGTTVGADGRTYHVTIRSDNSQVTVDSNGTFGDSCVWILTIVQAPG